MTWFGLMVVGVTALLGLSACQAAVVHHGRRSEHFVPRNPRVSETRNGEKLG